VFGHLRSGPLAIIRESWLGERELPADVNDRPTAEKYLIDLRAKLEMATEYANQHSKIEKSRFVRAYNRRARDKYFSVGENV